MSAGPIKAWREGSVSPKVSTANADRVCKTASLLAYCGRSNGRRAKDWPNVTCADCRAAGRADGLAVP